MFHLISAKSTRREYKMPKSRKAFWWLKKVGFIINHRINNTVQGNLSIYCTACDYLYALEINQSAAAFVHEHGYWSGTH